MENNSTEISASSTSTETNTPQKPKRIRIPGRKRGVGKKNLLKKRFLYNLITPLITTMRNVRFPFCVLFVVGKQQKPNYIGTSSHCIVQDIQKILVK